MTPLVVCGLAAEAKIVRGSDPVRVIAAGGDARRLLAELDRLAPGAVLSFGVAGGLAPGLVPGDVRVADAVVAPDGRRLPTDKAWSEAIAAALSDILPRAKRGGGSSATMIATFAGVDGPLAGADAKAALHRTTGAALVDMESHLVAEWAAARGARFAALRVVTDPAERSLPHAATVGMRADGKVDLAAILKSLGSHPGQLPGLIRTGLDAKTAFAALLRCRQRLGPGFALLDLV